MTYIAVDGGGTGERRAGLVLEINEIIVIIII